ncbi:unnamed protein product, partial [Polarella glacialis]
MSPCGRAKIHVKLHGPAPIEYFAVTGSHEALGCWNPASGVPLEWRAGSWVTEKPVAIAPQHRVEFKFVRVGGAPGSVEWEDGPNRVLEVPVGKAGIHIQ